MAPHRNRPAPRPWRDRRGVAAAEAAVVVPFLILIILACVDFGRAISQSMSLTQAVKAGAQYAVTSANAQAAIEAAVRNALPAAMSAAAVSSTCYCGALPAGTGMPPVAACDSECPAGSARMMTIRATLPFTPMNFAVTPTLASHFNFNQASGNVTIRHQ